MALGRYEETNGPYTIIRDTNVRDYDNSKTVLKVRELDKSHVQILMNSPEVSEQLDIAIEDMYSVEGIEYQKRLLLRSIDP